MPDTTPNDPDNNAMHHLGSNDNGDMNYELITAYVDHQIKDENQEKRIQNLIESSNDYYNRYTFEKFTKETLQKKSKRIETPVYAYKNIGQGIDDYIKRVSKLNSVSTNVPSQIYSQQIGIQKSKLRGYLIYSSVAFIILIGAAFILNNFLKKNPELGENDLVAVSRKVFDKIKSDDGKVEHPTNDAKELTNFMNEYLDFKVFVPDVKDAILLGGVCNEINGEKLAHIVHKKGNIIIYTLEASKKEVMNNKDKIILGDQYKQSINEGKNWFPCLKDKNRTAVIWFKDNVICSTVSELEPQEITATLTNYK